RHLGAGHRRHPQRDPPAERLSLSLRLRHADRRRRAGDLVHVLRGGALMSGVPTLSIVTFLPLLGDLLVIIFPLANARWVALWTTLVTLAYALFALLGRFDAASAEFQFEEKVAWLGGTITYHMGVDGISLPFVILTAGLMPLCIIASWVVI